MFFVIYINHKNYKLWNKSLIFFKLLFNNKFRTDNRKFHDMNNYLSPISFFIQLSISLILYNICNKITGMIYRIKKIKIQVELNSSCTISNN